MTFQPLPISIFPGQKLWGAVFGDRFSFCIVFDHPSGYTASWKDTFAADQRATYIGGAYPTLADAEKACRKQAAKLQLTMH